MAVAVPEILFHLLLSLSCLADLLIIIIIIIHLTSLSVTRRNFPDRLSDHVVGLRAAPLLPGALARSVGREGTTEGLREDGAHC